MTKTAKTQQHVSVTLNKAHKVMMHDVLASSHVVPASSPSVGFAALLAIFLVMLSSISPTSVPHDRPSINAWSKMEL